METSLSDRGTELMFATITSASRVMVKGFKDEEVQPCEA